MNCHSWGGFTGCLTVRAWAKTVTRYSCNLSSLLLCKFTPIHSEVLAHTWRQRQKADLGMGNGRQVFGLLHGFLHSWLQLFWVWVRGNQSSANLTEFLHKSIMGYEILCLWGCCFNANSSPVPHGDYGTVTASWTPELEWPDRWSLTLCLFHEIWALETGERWAFWCPVRHVENYLGFLWRIVVVLCVCVCVCVSMCVFISSLRVSYVWFGQIHLNSSPSIFPIHLAVLLK